MRETLPSARQVIRFGVFEVDLQAGDLRKSGVKVKLQEKPFQVLAMLLERPGEVITREELQQRLWPDVNVDFEHSLSTAIKKLRDALDDSADTPRYIETKPGRGYRFIAPVEGMERRAWPRIQAFSLALVAAVILVAVLVGLNLGGLRDKLLGSPAPGEITSIAVLPLKNLSGDTEQEYFVDGMTEALITELSKIGALKVISRTSAMRYKETDKSLPEIARELNVDAVVEGPALHIGERVRITVQLIEAASDRNLWADNYDRELSDVLAMHSEVAQAIAREIKIAVTPGEETRLASARAVNPEAYAAYLKGRFHWYKNTPEDVDTAMKYFQLAINKDPNYALAYTGIAYVWGSRVHFGFVRPRDTFPGKAAALKALELDDTLSEAHEVFANDKFFSDWDWSAAEREYKRAIELNPNNPDARAFYSLFLTSMGRPQEALAEIQRCVEKL